MAHGYHTLQHWNQWLTHQFLGDSLLTAEANQLSTMLANHYGKQAVLIGVPHQAQLLKTTSIPCQSLLSPLSPREKMSHYIEGDFYELPIQPGSVDLVLIPHTLEFVDNPRQLLAEACRIVKPEGLMMICGFNPYSVWGVKKIITKRKKIPWSGNFIQPRDIRNWLRLADFVIEKQTSVLFTPPVNYPPLYKRLHVLEQIGNRCFSLFGGVYMILARAKVVPLTPIRLKWKQQLSGIKISTTISGHIARRSE